MYALFYKVSFIPAKKFRGAAALKNLPPKAFRSFPKL
jgi:hypothetical protein